MATTTDDYAPDVEMYRGVALSLEAENDEKTAVITALQLRLAVAEAQASETQKAVREAATARDALATAEAELAAERRDVARLGKQLAASVADAQSGATAADTHARRADKAHAELAKLRGDADEAHAELTRLRSVLSDIAHRAGGAK
jgi:chromosome segregation ATPase